MSQARRPRSRVFTINRPEWQTNLPRALRIAGEWQFGTMILVGIVVAIRMGNIVAIGGGFVPQFLMFLILSGWAENKRINSRVAWWALSIGIGLMGAVVLLGVIFDPPEHWG